MLVCADTHVHLYPCYALGAALGSLHRNLAGLAPDGASDGVALVALLAERGDCAFFRCLREEGCMAGDGGYELRHGPEAAAATLWFRGAPCAYVLAGRQVATRERLEVLVLAADAAIADGAPAREVIAETRGRGALAAVAWSPGKWTGARGRLVEALVEETPPGGLLLADTALRPRGWPEPRLMRRARAKGFGVLAGSDPLPFPGEERRIGCYATCWEGSFDPERPAASVRAALDTPSPALHARGTRLGVAAVAWRLARVAWGRVGTPAR